MIPTLPPVGVGDLLAAGELAQVGPPGRPRGWTLHEDPGDPAAFVVRGEPGAPPGDDDRVLRLAGGAALLTMRLAVRLLGRRLHVHLLPDAHDPWTLARLRVGSGLAPTEAERTLAAAMRPGRSADGPERVPPPASPSARTRLRRAAEAERGWLVWLEDDPDEPPAEAEGHGFLVLGTVDDDPLAHLRAGQAAQRVLLTATVHGLVASVVTRPLASPEARAALRTRLGGGLWPQAVLRVGPAGPR